MKPIGKHIIIKTIDEEIVSKSGLILSADDTSKLRYRKGEVFAVGTGVDIIDNGDIIYYNASGTNTAVGTIQSINSDTSITLTSNATVTLGGTGTFLYVIRSGFAEGDRLKGNYMTA